MYLLRVHYKKKKRSEKDLFDIDYAIFLIFFINAYVVGTHLNCIDVDAIQMSTHNICLYKEVDKKVHCLSS